jgi:hypothetical protein
MQIKDSTSTIVADDFADVSALVLRGYLIADSARSLEGRPMPVSLKGLGFEP